MDEQIKADPQPPLLTPYTRSNQQVLYLIWVSITGCCERPPTVSSVACGVRVRPRGFPNKTQGFNQNAEHFFLCEVAHRRQNHQCCSDRYTSTGLFHGRNTKRVCSSASKDPTHLDTGANATATPRAHCTCFGSRAPPAGKEP